MGQLWIPEKGLHLMLPRGSDRGTTMIGGGCVSPWHHMDMAARDHFPVSIPISGNHPGLPCVSQRSLGTWTPVQVRAGMALRCSQNNSHPAQEAISQRH